MTKLAGFSQRDLIAAHQYQYDGSHRNPNECGLCAMTTLLHLGARAAGSKLDLSAVELGKALDRIPFRHPRFPAWFPGPGGATHPRAALKGLEQNIRRLRREGQTFPWWPALKTRQTPTDLEAQLRARQPTLIYGVGHTGIPHVVVPIGREKDGWLILDPGYPTERNPMQWTDEKLERWWVGYWLFYPRGTMLSLVRENP